MGGPAWCGFWSWGREAACGWEKPPGAPGGDCLARPHRGPGGGPCPEQTCTVGHGRNPEETEPPWQAPPGRGQVGRAGWERREVFHWWELPLFFLCSNKIHTMTLCLLRGCLPAPGRPAHTVSHCPLGARAFGSHGPSSPSPSRAALAQPVTPRTSSRPLLDSGASHSTPRVSHPSLAIRGPGAMPSPHACSIPCSRNPCCPPCSP